MVCHSGVFGLVINNAEVMIDDEGFTQRSRAAQAKTQSLH